MENFIKSELAQYNDYQAQIDNDDSFLEFFEDQVRTQRSKVLKAKIKMMNAWLLILTPEEQLIMKRHVIDKLGWEAVVFEHGVLWGKDCSRSKRSLYKRQATALFKIEEFIRKDEDAVIRVFSLPTE